MLSRWFGTATLFGLVSLSACATMITGRNQQIPINVQPVGANVCLDGAKIGTSPMVARLSRKQPHVIVLVRDAAPGTPRRPVCAP